MPLQMTSLRVPYDSLSFFLPVQCAVRDQLRLRPAAVPKSQRQVRRARRAARGANLYSHMDQ